MYRTQIGCTFDTGAFSTASSSFFFALGQNYGYGSAVGFTEVQAQGLAGTTGLFGRMILLVTSNARASTSTVTFRVEGADTLISIPIPAGLTGTFSDLTNVARVTQNQKFCGCIANGTGAGTLTLAEAWITHRAVNATTVTYMFESSVTTITAGGAPDVMYGAQGMSMPVAGTFSYLSIYIDSAGDANVTATFRKNGANGTQTVTALAGLTGRFTDTTHSDAVAEDDLINIRIATGGSVDVDFTHAGVMFTSGTVGAAPVVAWRNDFIVANSTYASLLGNIAPTTTVGNLAGGQAGIRVGTLSKMRLLVFNGTNTGNVTYKYTNNTSVGSQVVTYPNAGASGWYKDTTHSDALALQDSPLGIFAGLGGGENINIGASAIRLTSQRERIPIPQAMVLVESQK